MKTSIRFIGPECGELIRSIANTKRAIEDTLIELGDSSTSENRRTELLWRLDTLLDGFFGANATRRRYVLDVLNEFEGRFKLGNEELEAFSVVRIRADGLSQRVDDFQRNGSLMRRRRIANAG